MRILLTLLLILSLPSQSKDYFLNMKGLPTQGGLTIAQTVKGAKVSIDGEAVMVTPEGFFMFGFGRFDTENKLIEITSNNQAFKTVVEVLPRKFPTEEINGLPQSQVSPPAGVYERIKSDNVKVAKARAFKDLREDFLQPFIWPSQGRVSGVYGSRRVLNGTPKRPHYGMDIANATGTLVVAAASGIVRLAEEDMYYTGGSIIIDHGYGLSTTYIHLSQVNVTVGDEISQGEKIGEIGATGRATGPHLDWRLNLGKTRLDPQLVIKKTYQGL